MIELKRKRDIYPYALLTPAMAVTLLIIFVPIVNTLIMSTMSYIIFKPQDRAFVLFENYRTVLQDEVFWVSLRHTVVWIVGTILGQLVLGFVTALLLNQEFAWRGLARSLILIPWVTPSVITALMWRWMYDGNHGVINDLLVRVGILAEYFPWLADSSTALPAIMFALTWQGFPFFAIMILAGLQAIPGVLYEVADVDGAGAARKLVSITLPMVMPILLTSLLLRIIWVANSLDVIYIMTGGGPGYATYTLPVYAYITAYKTMDFGYASTLSIYLTVFLVAFVAFYVTKVIREGVR